MIKYFCDRCQEEITEQKKKEIEFSNYENNIDGCNWWVYSKEISKEPSDITEKVLLSKLVNDRIRFYVQYDNFSGPDDKKNKLNIAIRLFPDERDYIKSFLEFGKYIFVEPDDEAYKDYIIVTGSEKDSAFLEKYK